jgi:RNA polymerase sigma-70 factor (ECF subfamily)
MISSVTTDHALIEAIARQDPNAMQTLFARYRVKVFRFVRRIVHDEATAEDLTADVFLNVWRSAGCFEGRSAVATWLLAIARFKALSVLRRRRESALDASAATLVPDCAPGPETALADKHNGEILRACLSQLSSDQREVIDLVYYHEKSIHEVAQIVNIPTNTVKTRMFYARKRLARELAQAGLVREFL